MILNQLAESYEMLPSALAPAASFAPDATGIRGSKGHPPIPIRADVVDMMTSIGRHAAAWERETARAFRLSEPYWSRPARSAVPAALRWTAGIFDEPPERPDPEFSGRWLPGRVPDDLWRWVTDAATELHATALTLLRDVPAPRRSKCPVCGSTGRFIHPITNEARCVTCARLDGAA